MDPYEHYLLLYPRLKGKSRRYLEVHAIITAHISIFRLLFNRSKEMDRLAGVIAGTKED